MLVRTFIIGMVLVGITLILTELHRYMVYKDDVEREDKYAANYLRDEIEAIDKTLENNLTEGEEALLRNLKRDLINDLEEIEREEQDNE